MAVLGGVRIDRHAAHGIFHAAHTECLMRATVGVVVVRHATPLALLLSQGTLGGYA